MGIDLARICNHHLYFKNETEFVDKLSKGFNCKVFPTYIDNEELTNKESIIYLDDPDNNTIQQYIDGKELISMYKSKITRYDSFYINPHCIEFSFEEYYVGRWNTVKLLADEIKENGFPKKALYETIKNDFWFLNRKKYYDFIKTIGGTQSVIFCSDYHTKWLDYFADNYTIDDFIEWGKEEFIFVEFKDLIDFDFPDNKPDYYNVFILDNFEDLKSL